LAPDTLKGGYRSQNYKKPLEIVEEMTIINIEEFTQEIQ
jgi:hypothetical protein